MSDRGEHQRPSFLDQLQNILNPSATAAKSRKGHEAKERIERGMEWEGHSIQGRRDEQQDAWVIERLNIGEKIYDLAAVFDGHGFGGALVANKARERLGRKVEQMLADGANQEGALWGALLVLGQEMSDEKSGCTALAALISERKMYLAYVGDSLAVLLRGGVAYPLNKLHNPSLEEESQRILASGGVVRRMGKVLRVGAKGLAVSRAIGDAGVRGISHEPGVLELDLFPEDEIVLMCDGVWKQFPLKDLAAGAGAGADELASSLVNGAYARGSSDNLTAVVGKVI